MKTVLNAAEMREIDRQTTELYGIPGLTLMENAGAAVTAAVLELYGDPKELHAIVICGRGNNGGDGAVVARQLWQRGAVVDLFLIGELALTKGDARANFDIVQKLAGTESGAGGSLSINEIKTAEEWRGVASSLPAYDLLIDAILGTGLNRPAEELYATVLADLQNDCPIPIVSVDIPSGLSADSQQPFAPHLQSDLTVTFTAPKPANVLAPNCFLGGHLIVADIGSPEELILKSGAALKLIEENDVADFLAASRRQPDSHKGSVGSALIIAGSRGKTGAACLAAEAVLRAGAGLCTVATAESALVMISGRAAPEVMTEPLADTENGAIAQEAIERALHLIGNTDVLAIGPGLTSDDKSTRAFVRALLVRRTVPTVVDADGLNSLAPWADNLKGGAEHPLILTPHPGEMSRLTGLKTPEILADSVEVARRFATEHGVILVLKQARTIIAAPDGTVFINPTGNSGMSTAGSGDVLTGIITGLLAQRTKSPLEATIAGVYLHGLAGDLAAMELGVRSLIASDITRHLSAAFLQVGGEAEKPFDVIDLS